MNTTDLDFKQKQRLINLLLECPSVNSPEDRRALLAELPSHIADAIKGNNSSRMHVLNIVNSCATHADGLELLFDAVRFFDGETVPFQALAGFIDEAANKESGNGENNASPFDEEAPGRNVRDYGARTAKPVSSCKVRIFAELAGGRFHQGDPARAVPLENPRLSPDDILEIKGETVRLGDLSAALTDYDENWLETRFDEHGQYETGLYLYRQLFGEKAPAELQDADGKLDLRIIAEDENIARLPWMLLAWQGVFLSAAGWSISLAPDAEIRDCELPSSPKILIVAPRPEKHPDTEGHVQALTDLLSSADIAYSGGDKHLRIVAGWEDFKTALRDFQPHVLYYYGDSAGDRPALLFAGAAGKPLEKTAEDLLPLLQNDKPPLLVYINCRQGGGVAGKQLSQKVAAVAVNRARTPVSISQAQGMAFWEAVLLRGRPPHEATVRGQPGKSDWNDARWMTPVLHCRYDNWFPPRPPKPPLRLERDPHWQLKLDRVPQFSRVFFQTYQMFLERKPRALAYLWYGRPDQGSEIFHHRLKVELEEKLREVTVYEIRPDWPTDLHNPADSFADMLCQAFDIDSLEHLAGRIRAYGRQLSGQQMLVYVRHRPVISPLVFHPQYLRTYLEWQDLMFVPLLPERTHALLGISYEVEKPKAFHDLLVKKERLRDLIQSHTVFQLLDELERVTKRDLLDFLQTHNIELPADIKEDVLEKILDRTQGSYVHILDELRDLESRAWRLRREKTETERGRQVGVDAYDGVF
ncbi:MAG: hypothetical protein GY862_33815 [Gammaproteobacteria bacterium]|nr:hypothetical protein [Gammaproteobacteria bacterium]